MPGANKREIALMEKAANDFSAKILLPHHQENDRYPDAPFFEDALEKAKELDFFNMALSEEMGGTGGSMELLGALLSGLCRTDASMAALILVNAFCQHILLETGRGDLILSLGEKDGQSAKSLLACPVFANPSETGLQASAISKAGGWVLSGGTEFVSAANLASYALVPASTDKDGAWAWFLVDCSGKGVNISEPVFSLGLHACPSADMAFDKAKAILLGGQNSGPEIFDAVCGKFFGLGAFMFAGIMEGASKEALDYAKKREQGGRKIINWSQMQIMLADMAHKAHVAAILARAACIAVDEGAKDAVKTGLMAFVQTSADACDATTDGIQALGGVGYMKDFGQEKRFRDAKHLQALWGIYPLKKIRYLKMVTKI
ncbi:MAG: acyl-CoA dehydrogenase family protein [Desulfatibacillaceae bacterium]|nr:acyl-CoA dehydrogenase family protein [Desulfatibacillaceae bacterium]